MSSPAETLVVVALGGNAISPPRGGLSYADERTAVAAATAELATLAEAHRWRLLVVHGNGPQVGRLLRAAGSAPELDVHVAQTQGELGYLLAAGLEAHDRGPVHALITRVQVDPADPAFGQPAKAIGPVLDARPAGAARQLPEGGWRQLVASPAPVAVRESRAIAELLRHGHVVAGGGGGIPVTGSGDGVAAVVDKDRVAALLAVELDASLLLIGTDVPGVYADFRGPQQRLIRRLDATEARRGATRGAYEPGSMAPKVESAARFAAATGRDAVIGALGELEAAVAGSTGTRVVP